MTTKAGVTRVGTHVHEVQQEGSEFSATRTHCLLVALIKARSRLYVGKRSRIMAFRTHFEDNLIVVGPFHLAIHFRYW